MGGQNNWLDHVWESLKPYELDGAGHTRKENAELYSSMTTNVRLDLLQQLEEQRVAGGKHLDPILKMCESHLYNEMDDIDNVLRAFKEGKLATMSRVRSLGALCALYALCSVSYTAKLYPRH